MPFLIPTGGLNHRTSVFLQPLMDPRWRKKQQLLTYTMTTTTTTTSSVLTTIFQMNRVSWFLSVSSSTSLEREHVWISGTVCYGSNALLVTKPGKPTVQKTHRNYCDSLLSVGGTCSTAWRISSRSFSRNANMTAVRYSRSATAWRTRSGVTLTSSSNGSKVTLWSSE